MMRQEGGNGGKCGKGCQSLVGTEVCLRDGGGEALAPRPHKQHPSFAGDRITHLENTKPSYEL